MINLETLKKYRKEMNLTQDEVALVLGYKNRSSYCLVENGNKNLLAEQLYLLSKLFNKPMESFFLDYDK